jgi:hypothetical protein
MSRNVNYKITIDDTDWTEFQKDLYERNINFAMLRAFHQTVVETRALLQRGAQAHFIGGAVRFTKSSIVYYKGRDKRNAYADVRINPNGNRDYIMDTIIGGEVVPIRGEVRVRPVNMRLTREGNISNKMRSGKIRKMLAQKDKYFSGTPKGRPKSDDLRGIWQRKGRGKNKKPRMIAHYKESWHQKPVFPAFDIAEAGIERSLGTHVARELHKATKGRIG